mmetsp:Transcript_13464/g.24960  ORF Transcript_13464/g.24960 Transcript_13464/m.24960 type:complete len:285 (+) Transcript_13464:106-960(+)|eukprot:CAMPEP_0114430604 /NCGR_PEP_ID=MMETSP0103-20121206/10131_1 /TAXON_ID=37642 ORGANISM="Paraphysomonas imperforata, Strain PA2" /NCGR_SAMPLE_ID=MMETSP0103 /ASSEMBLY_ACC=CAM_ASM_000201 /LENGTH=284 /DNA_ID=CAMNT_0001600065 /DNA_START=67 /DNA_END=921 /DNA_ORIENTATION=-
MGAASSVQKPSSTFLTAYDYNEEDEIAAEEEPAEEESEHQNMNDDSSGVLQSVCTEDYNPPPNRFYKEAGFEEMKKNHLQLKKKYVKYLHSYMKEAIPQSINHATFISSLRLRERGGHDKNHKYNIDPEIIADMETRGSLEKAKAYKRGVLNSVRSDVAHKNRALAFRVGVSGNMTLPCATFMDDKTSEYLNSIDYLGVGENRLLGRSSEAVQRELWLEKKARLHIGEPVENNDDSATMIEFKKYFDKREKKEIRRRNRKATWIERYRDVMQKLREKYVNYDYE